MTDLTITWKTLLVILGGLIVFFDFGKRLVAVFIPIFQKKDEIESKITAINTKLDNDKIRLDKIERTISQMIDYQEKSSAVIGLSVAELLNHTITGNDIVQLKKREEELNRFFYKNEGVDINNKIGDTL